MKHLMKVLFATVLLVCVFALAGCGAKDQYAINDQDGYTVSVQYHANGGQFATNTFTITDCYKPDGKTELMLIDPNSEDRQERFEAKRNGYFLAGWYTERKDTGKKDENGDPIYTYSGRWDFKKDTVALESGKTYTSAEPVLNLYAAWIPNVSFEIYDLADPTEPMKVIPINPTDPEQLELTLPTFDQSTGRPLIKDLPQKTGYTFNALYLDAEGTQKVEGTTVKHSGNINLENATVEGTVMKLYVDYMEGEYIAVYKAQKFLDGLSTGKNMIIMKDLDFATEVYDENYDLVLDENGEAKMEPMQLTDHIWNTENEYEAAYGGTILGNGHTISNITVKVAPTYSVANEDYLFGGLMGKLESTAVIKDLNFANVKVEICEAEGMVQPTAGLDEVNIGLLAGQIEEGAIIENVTFTDCVVELDVSISKYQPNVGLISGNGIAADYTGITVTLSDTRYDFTVSENGTVMLKMAEVENSEQEVNDEETTDEEATDEEPTDEEKTDEQEQEGPISGSVQPDGN